MYWKNAMSAATSTVVLVPVYVSLAEIAELLGVSKRSAQRYIAREDLAFPAPKQTLATGRIWLRSEVANWKKRTLPLTEGSPAHRKPPR